MRQTDTLSSPFQSTNQEPRSPLRRRINAHPRIALAAVGAVSLALIAIIAWQGLYGGIGQRDTASEIVGQPGNDGYGAEGDLIADSSVGISLSYSQFVDNESAKGSVGAPPAAPSTEAATDPMSASAVSGQTALETSGRSIISTSSVAIEVESVPGAIDQLRVVANSAGGFIETLSTTGGADPERGTATIRVPGTAFLTTLQRVKELGTVVGETVGSDDVTEQVIDLGARLRSEQAKEVSFLELLDKASTVSDLLSIERELSRVRTEIERLTGQLSFIEQRVNLATINVSFGQPSSLNAEAPSASLALDTTDVEEAVVQLKAIVEQADGEVESTSISLNNGVMQAFVGLRVAPADFDDTIFRIAQLGDVTAKEIREPGATSDLPESDEATARITVTFNQSWGSRNWWLWAGAPAGALALVLLLAVVYRIGSARNRA